MEGTVATARERLLKALLTVVSQPASIEAKTTLKRLLNNYRVQAKPETNVEDGLTARDSLANKIIFAWQSSPLDKKAICEMTDGYRMQLKNNAKKAFFENEADSSKTVSHIGPNLNEEKGKDKINHENAYFKESDLNDKQQNLSAIAGGPIAQNSKKGQCPKCKSQGIVIARVYQKDDYYSCIYCGYQSFVSNDTINDNIGKINDTIISQSLEPDFDPEN